MIRPSGIVTLTTDFGTRDYFVGAMKGVILGVNPEVQIVDIAHDLPPQDVPDAAFVLSNAYRHFPNGTVHCVVVDPGVGSERKPLVVAAGDQFFVGPDNGVFSFVYERETIRGIFEIANRTFMRPEISDTFHGRDLFAPAAAHLSKGIPPDAFGPEMSEYIRLDIVRPSVAGGILTGTVVHVDRFGNLVTNISRGAFAEFTAGRSFEIRMDACRIHSLSTSYAEVRPREPLALFGSADLLELSVNSGSAAELLGVGRGATIFIKRRK